jgi:hypothetical protein
MSLFRRRPLFSMTVWAVLSWVVAGWWWGPVESTSLRLDRTQGCSVLGLSQEGSLLWVERTPHTANWSVWKWTFPDSLQNVGCDLIQADTGCRIALPQWFLPSSISPGGSREEWALYTHPRRLAFHNEETGFVRVLEMPPVERTGWRVLTALALFAGPGFWCWRTRAK